MDPVHVVDAWLAVAAMAVLAWLGWSAWPRLAVDIARQSLFEIRDKLFDRAAAGELEFSDPSYRLARGVLNAMIRNANHATVWRYISYSRALSRHGALPAARLVRELRQSNGTPPEIRRALMEADRVYSRLLVFRSPALTVMALALGGMMLLGKRLQPTGSVTIRAYRRLRAKATDASDADVAIDLGSRPQAV